MRRWLAGFLTIALMGALLWSGARRPEPSSPPSSRADEARRTSGAEGRLDALLASSAQGDVSGYIACFGGGLRTRLEQQVNERGRKAFAEDLRRASLARKSHAVFSPEPDGPDAARITVESVYPDRNETQTYRLERNAGEWLITGVDTVRSHEPKAKYGAPANYQEPEGMPLQGAITVETGDDGARNE